MTTTPKPPGYAVGFARPPTATRFVKGQSGNPKGRPKGSKNRAQPVTGPGRLEEIILQEAFRAVDIRDGDRTLTLPVAQVAVRSIMAKAARGDHRAQHLAVELVQHTEETRRRAQEETFELALRYKLHWDEVLATLKREGRPPPDPLPLPHPDDIVLDFRTGEVRLVGPFFYKERETLTGLTGYVEGLLDELDFLREDLALAREPSLAEGTRDGDVAEPPAYCEELIRSTEQAIRRFLATTTHIAVAWPGHWPPPHLRHRLRQVQNNGGG